MSLPPLRWMIRRDLHAAHEDPMLPRGTRKCWCPECGLYFNSLRGFTEHRTTERECRAAAGLRRLGWTQGPQGHWLIPGAVERLAELRRQTVDVLPIERRSAKT